MEACGGAHHWARELTALDHAVRLIPPQYVKPYVKRSKNDRNDAEAICEAAGRPGMHFVPVKCKRSGSAVGPFSTVTADPRLQLRVGWVTTECSHCVESVSRRTMAVAVQPLRSSVTASTRRCD
jgi:hypothetical protein